MRRILGCVVLALALLSAGGAVGRAATLTVSSGKLTVVRTCLLSANSSTSPVEVDTSVQEGNPTSNLNGSSTVDVATDKNQSKHQRTYIKFFLTACQPAIPSTAVIRLATLRLYATNLPPDCRTHDIFRVLSSWDETVVTWNNQPFGTTLNNPAAAQRTSSLAVGPLGCQNSTVNSYVSGWTVTADVQAFVGGANNFGWMIRDDAEDYITNEITAYASKEATRRRSSTARS